MDKDKLTQQELISKCFYYLNSFKRHRALEEISKHEGKYDQVNYNKLKQYQFIDQLELGLRALQKGEREINQDESQN